jgi:hypothetical protein
MGRYNDRQRGQDSRTGKKRSGRRFLQLFTNVKRSTAYHGLRANARALLFEIIDRYTGCNNGVIGLGVREAAYELQCSQSSAGRSMRELDDSGLARPMKIGAWRGKRATEWRLMFLRCDRTGDLAVTVWEQRVRHSECHHESTKVPPVGNRDTLSPTTEAQTRNSSMNGKSLSPTSGTHIDSYQGEGGTAELTQKGELLAESPLESESNQGPSSNVAISANPKNLTKRRKP